MGVLGRGDRPPTVPLTYKYEYKYAHLFSSSSSSSFSISFRHPPNGGDLVSAEEVAETHIAQPGLGGGRHGRRRRPLHLLANREREDHRIRRRKQQQQTARNGRSGPAPEPAPRAREVEPRPVERWHTTFGYGRVRRCSRWGRGPGCPAAGDPNCLREKIAPPRSGQGALRERASLYRKDAISSRQNSEFGPGQEHLFRHSLPHSFLLQAQGALDSVHVRVRPPCPALCRALSGRGRLPTGRTAIQNSEFMVWSALMVRASGAK